MIVVLDAFLAVMMKVPLAVSGWPGSIPPWWSVMSWDPNVFVSTSVALLVLATQQV